MQSLKPLHTRHTQGYSIGFDPLDGSSVIDANFAVGSIFGLWPGRGLLQRTGREQSASCMAVYGPRTTLAVALAAHVTAAAAVAFDLALNPVTRSWSVARQQLTIAPAGRVFAPGNLRATADNAQYAALFAHWVAARYTLRYTGGMVPDVYHMFIKGKGVFSNVSSAAAPAKLRLVYECAPIALLVEAAGGTTVMAPSITSSSSTSSSNGNGSNGCSERPISVLDVVIDDLDKRLGVCFGGSEEVAVFNKFMFEAAQP
jgi:sedoheptulose-bisphosphatase